MESELVEFENLLFGRWCLTHFEEGCMEDMKVYVHQKRYECEAWASHVRENIPSSIQWEEYSTWCEIGGRASAFKHPPHTRCGERKGELYESYLSELQIDWEKIDIIFDGQLVL